MWGDLFCYVCYDGFGVEFGIGLMYYEGFWYFLVVFIECFDYGSVGDCGMF